MDTIIFNNKNKQFNNILKIYYNIFSVGTN